MKYWAAVILFPFVMLLGACEKHPVSDLQKVDEAPEAAASPAAK